MVEKKHLTINGPDFLGLHHIYITENLKHVIIIPKKDFTTDVFIGDVARAKEWRKYDPKQNILFSQVYDDYEAFEWKIYKDIILYKGNSLPPKDIPEEPYWGKVLETEIFDNNINDEWIVSQIRKLYKN